MPPRARWGHGQRVPARAAKARSQCLQLPQVQHGANTQLCTWLSPAPPSSGSLVAHRSVVQELHHLLCLVKVGWGRNNHNHTIVLANTHMSLTVCQALYMY